jgi:outer membrane protein assembly factor BamD (BamD/ComL family)
LSSRLCFAATDKLEFAEVMRALAAQEEAGMTRRIIAAAVLACALFCMSLEPASAQRLSQNASVDHAARMLFEQAQRALKKSNYAKARSLLQTLIDTHPESDYVPRAKISIADSFYSEHAFRQAELEYRDFITFFPNRPEVAEAESRIDSIHKDATF